MIRSDIIIAFIQEIAEKYRESHATCFVHEYNKIFIHNSESKTIELPSYFTKRRIYRLYAYE